MEENKEVKAKPTYEELEAAVNDLNNKVQAYAGLNGELSRRLMSSDLQNMFKRLDFLFKVVEFENVFDVKFVNDCVDEIQQLLTIPKDKTEETE